MKWNNYHLTRDGHLQNGEQPPHNSIILPTSLRLRENSGEVVNHLLWTKR